MSKKSQNFRFIEVCVTFGKLDFSLVFLHPQVLSMKRFNPKAGVYCPVRPDDWLVVDFPFLLSRRLSILEPDVLSVNVYPFSQDLSRDALPVYQGNSFPSSWIDPFVTLIASTFLNSYAHVTGSK